MYGLPKKATESRFPIKLKSSPRKFDGRRRDLDLDFIPEYDLSSTFKMDNIGNITGATSF